MVTAANPNTVGPGLRAAEFFAGVGLVRAGLDEAGFCVVWANDIDASKRALYAANFDVTHFMLADVRAVRGDAVPDVELATASFPCTDFSLAGYRAGLSGEQSGMFWQLARVLKEMEGRRPLVVMLENVPSFATSKGGKDLRAAIAKLNDLGYICDVFVVNARHFVPQSRARLFIVGSAERLSRAAPWSPSEIRPPWIQRFVRSHPDLALQALDLRLPTRTVTSFADVVERLSPDDERWWDMGRSERFVSSLSPIQAARLEQLRNSLLPVWATAYRRTRNNTAVWEIRSDHIAGCLRTTRGGSSKQAVVEAGGGEFRIRWMTPRECARLQGAPDFVFDGVTRNQALFGLGDAVCVPVVSWIARKYLRPLVEGKLTASTPDAMAYAC
jgi:DNA (cytosine-5)-methyltransferase 1